jgi:membrane protease YdiL (CAAX protease family)
LLAVSLVLIATSAVVFGVGAFRSRSHPADTTAEATRFAVSAEGIATAALVSAGVFAGGAIVGARLQARDFRTQLRLRPTHASVAGVVSTIVGMVGLSLASGAASDLLGGRGRGTMGVIAHSLEHPTPGRLLISIATIAIAPGVAEETFFRGFIQTRLTSRWGRWPSIGVTALGFGLVHFDLVQGLVAFVAGLFLGWVVERFGGIRPSIGAHACNNTAFVVLASFGSDAEGTRTNDVVAIAAGLVAWLGATLLIQSRFAVTGNATARSLRE